MDKGLQFILIAGTVCFLLFILLLVKKNRLQMKYALLWILLVLIYLVLAIFPDIVGGVAALLHIKEKVNALFLITIFFILVLSFVYNLLLSKHSGKIRHLIQEISILRSEIDRLNKTSEDE